MFEFLYLNADEKVDAEDTEEAELVEDVLLGGWDHLLVVVDDQADGAAEDHRAEEGQAYQGVGTSHRGDLKYTIHLSFPELK